MRVVRLAEQPGHTVADALQYLAEYGITLPEDTDEEDFLDRLCVALHALKGGKGQTGTRPAPEVTEEAPQPVTMSLTRPPGVRLSQPVDDAAADEIVRLWDVATGRGKGA